MRTKGILLALAAVLLLSISPLPADLVIERGIDVFTTTANGKTHYNFAKNPIPAGFFCKGSPAFTGRVTLKGLPLETEIPGQLRGADTIVERLDDAVFDESRTASTRVRFRALSLVSIAPIKTACGAYHVYITLSGKQRETVMRIRQTHERGGSFVAPLSVGVRLSFVPVKKGGSPRNLELPGRVNFRPQAMPWSFADGREKSIGRVVVDTNGDMIPETLLAGTSNFAAGWAPDAAVAVKGCTMCEPEMCHTNSGEEHCTGPVYACYPYNCP
jgi:hypothetical protein